MWGRFLPNEPGSFGGRLSHVLFGGIGWRQFEGYIQIPEQMENLCGKILRIKLADYSMQNESIKEIARQLLASDLTESEFLTECLKISSTSLSSANLDSDRKRRCGFPEVIYGEGKPVPVLIDIMQQLIAEGLPVLATRISAQKADELVSVFSQAIYNELGRTFRIEVENAAEMTGRVAVVSAGTSDRYVAEEALETLHWMRVETDFIQDAGVAGPQRLLANVDRLRRADAVVVVAGMEGALPSIVGGHVSAPVVAVPTSVGYGASFGGLAAMLGMLNSCASNVTVVNIDAGFKGGYVAGIIAKQSKRENDEPAQPAENSET